METYNIYKDIATRSNGDVYLGVVGPVRTGKSTFIRNFVNQLVLPNILNTYAKQRTIDELPQSGDGKLVMTTQPKFVPDEAVKINIEDTELSVRLIDCVGFMVSGAMSSDDSNKTRLVKTPWSKDEMPFEEAAELGTKKVITEHSNIAVLVTTDGSFTQLDRASYMEAEEKVVNELKHSNKPFVIVLNTVNPNDESCQNMAKALCQKYGVQVLPMDCANLTLDDITKIMEAEIKEFPINSILVKMPRWMEALPYDNPLIKEIVGEMKNSAKEIQKIGDYKMTKSLFENSENFEPLTESKVILGEGNIAFTVQPKPHLFYKVLSDETGCEITSDFELISHLKELAVAKKEYDKVKVALDSVQETGYGVVFPSLDEMKLEDPEIVKQGSKFGVRLKASAPSLHIMKVDINTEVSPIVGTEQQSEDLVKSMLRDFESNPQGIWETNMFGKSLHQLVNEGLNNKLNSIPVDIEKKMRKTMSRIVNEGKGGVICILL